MMAQCSTNIARRYPIVKLNPTNYDSVLSDTNLIFIFEDTGFYSIHPIEVPDTNFKDGLWRYYSPKSPKRLLLEVKYSGGVKNGPIVIYNEKGDLSYRLNYKNGQRHGNYIRLDEQDTVSIQNFHFGKKNGIQKSFDLKGKVSSIENYKNGLRHGEFYRWDSKGRISEFKIFKDNLPIGMSMRFKNGQLSSERYFENGRAYREVFAYETKPKSKFSIGKGKKTQYDWTQTERVIQKEVFITGDSLFRVVEYYPNGKVKLEKHEIFFGQEDCHNVYHLHGLLKEYDSNGELIRDEFYENNILIKPNNH